MMIVRSNFSLAVCHIKVCVGEWSAFVHVCFMCAHICVCVCLGMLVCVFGNVSVCVFVYNMHVCVYACMFAYTACVCL